MSGEDVIHDHDPNTIVIVYKNLALKVVLERDGRIN